MSTILIVEDNEKNMKLVRDILQHQGHTTLEAATGGEVQASTPEEMRALIQSQIAKWADVINTSNIPRL